MLSRVAEQLYWMARYLERAQNLARRLNVMTVLSVDSSRPEDAWARLLGELGETPGHVADLDDMSMLHHLTFDPACSVSVAWGVRHARDNARLVRDIVSREIWQLLSQMKTTLDVPADWGAQPDGNGCAEVLNQVTLHAHAVEGLIDSTILRDEGYHWLQIGVLLERTLSTLHVLLAYADLWQAASGLEPTIAMAILKSVTSYGAFRRAYRTSLGARDILEFLLFEGGFPRSVAGGLAALRAAVAALPEPAPALRQSLGRLAAQVVYDGIDQVEAVGARSYLWTLSDRIGQVHGDLSARYFQPEVVEA
ncbi:MAG: alpha-E domain-containing protein [Thermaerobacter sp.]|nr:alpha-E domain-containing protein [Thermaerobacter sp.]